MSSAPPADDDLYESVLLVIKECYVYRASDWDVSQFLWQGRLRVIAKGDNAFINLEDSSTGKNSTYSTHLINHLNVGELFAVCPYKLDNTTVEAVTDSSRYFVLTIVDPGSGKHAFIGLGFPERSMSFDFNVALQDHAKRVKKEADVGNKPKPAENTGPKVDYSLKDDQKITINIGRVASASLFASTSTPSPPASKTVFSNDPFASSPSISSSPGGGDGFGDFVAATDSVPSLSDAFSAVSVAEGAKDADEGWANFESFNAGTTSTAANPEEWTKF
ncbi:hypothetical protein HDU67_002810 [Dinochytrium kinnereticum]|nr:hypothetical protein HDU67_002810 [Dinochytrium kinnereticum]